MEKEVSSGEAVYPETAVESEGLIASNRILLIGCIYRPIRVASNDCSVTNAGNISPLSGLIYRIQGGQKVQELRSLPWSLGRNVRHFAPDGTAPDGSGRLEQHRFMCLSVRLGTNSASVASAWSLPLRKGPFERIWYSMSIHILTWEQSSRGRHGCAVEHG